MESRRARRTVAALALGALFGTWILYHATAPWGPGVHIMGTHNFAAAEGLRSGAGMRMSGGEPFTSWPPLLPVLLALGRSLGLGYPTAGLVINLASQAAILFLGSYLLLRLFGSPALAFAGLLSLLASHELFDNARHVHSEPLFIALVLATLCALPGCLEKPSGLRLGLVAALAGLACLQRYVGVFLVASVALVLLRFPSSLRFRARCLRAAVFAAVSVFPLVLWALRNQLVEETPGGPRYASERTLFEDASVAGRHLAMWLAQWTSLREPRGVLNVTVAVVLCALAVVRVVRIVRSGGGEEERRALWIYFAFPVVYLVSLVAISQVVMLDPLYTRLLLPLYPFVWGTVLLGAAEGWRLLSGRPAWLRVPVAAAVLGLFGVHLARSGAELTKLVRRCREEGNGGFGLAERARSPLVVWLRANPPQGEVYATLPELVLYAAGRSATRVDRESLPRLLEGGPDVVHVVWSNPWRDVGPLPDLSETGRRLTCVVRSEDGAVYRAER